MLNNPIFIALTATLFINAILFLQSGLDKVLDYQGNLSWLKGHFANSPFKNIVPLLLIKLTFLEIITGSVSLVAALVGLLYDFESTETLYIISFGLGSVSIISLFLGQRIAKDYAGAASLIPYFIVQVLGFVLIELLF